MDYEPREDGRPSEENNYYNVPESGNGNFYGNGQSSENAGFYTDSRSSENADSYKNGQPEGNGSFYTNGQPEGNGSFYTNGQPEGGGFYGGENFRRPPSFIPADLWRREKNNLRKLSAVGGGSMLLYIILSSLFVGAFQMFMGYFKASGSADYNAFALLWNTARVQYLFQILYSVLFVGGPFFLLGYLTRKSCGCRIPAEKPKNPSLLPLIVFAAFGICLIGNIITGYFNEFIETLFGVEINLPETVKTPFDPLGINLYFVSSAVVPAFIEEMALRGVIMQPLRRYGDMFAVLCSSFVFALMHCNLVQIPFAFIAGIAIGYAVIITESIWTGIIIHFINNAFSVAVTIVADFYGTDSSQYMLCNIFFYGFIVLGLICAFILFRFKTPKKLYKSPLVNVGRDFSWAPHPFSAKISNKTLAGAYIGTGPMIIAIIAVAYETIMALMLY